MCLIAGESKLPIESSCLFQGTQSFSNEDGVRTDFRYSADRWTVGESEILVNFHVWWCKEREAKNEFYPSMEHLGWKTHSRPSLSTKYAGSLVSHSRGLLQVVLNRGHYLCWLMFDVEEEKPFTEWWLRSRLALFFLVKKSASRIKVSSVERGL